MPTIENAAGFEIPDTDAYGVRVGSTDATVSSAHPQNGTGALKCAAAASNSGMQFTNTSGRWGWTASNRTSIRFGVYIETMPGATVNIISGTNFSITVSAAGVLTATCGSGTPVTGPTITTGQYYVIELENDTHTASSWVLRWRVDNSVQTNATYTGSATTPNTTTFTLGQASGSNTFIFHFDDLALSSTSGDYPIGNGKSVLLGINGCGTHVITTGAFQDDAGTTISVGETTSYTRLQSIDTTSYVNQTTADGTSFSGDALSYTLDNTTGSLTPQHMMLFMYRASSDASTSSGGVVFDDGTSHVVGCISIAGATYAWSTLSQSVRGNSQGAWTNAALDAATIRSGFAGAVAHKFRLSYAAVEVDYATTYAITYSIGPLDVTGAGAITVSGAKQTGVVGAIDVTGAAAINVSAAAHTAVVGALDVTGNAGIFVSDATRLITIGPLDVTGTGAITIGAVTQTAKVGALDVTGTAEITVSELVNLGGSTQRTADIEVSRDGGPWEDIGRVEEYTWTNPDPAPGIHTICFRAVIDGIPQEASCCSFTVLADHGEPPPPTDDDCNPDIGPLLFVELALGTNPGDQLDLAEWTDVTEWVRGIPTVTRGRAHELDPFDTATATVRFNNRDRRFDPTNTASPYAPNLRPETPIRIYAFWCGTLYWIFTGYIERWPPLRSGPRDSAVEVTATDGFDLLAGQDFNQFLPSGLTGERINALLDLAEWPAAMRRIDTGAARLQSRSAQIGVFDSVLAVMQEAVAAEQGQLYMAADGFVVFEDRHSRLQSADTQATIGDAEDGTEVPYSEFEGELSRDEVRNHIVVTIQIPDGLSGTPAPQEVSDADSRAAYQRRTYELSDLPLATDDEALNLATWLLSRYKDPHFRITALALRGQMDWTLLAPAVLGLEISSRVTIVHRPPGGGTPNPLTINGYVEQIQHTVTNDGLPLRWVTQLVVSPAELFDYWVLEDPVLGVLDSTTRLGP